MHYVSAFLPAAALALTAATAASADQVTEYPCSAKYEAPADFCAEVWAKTRDSAWMVFDVEFKKPADTADTAEVKAKLMQYNGMFFNTYQIRSKDDTAKTLPMPMGAAQKWAYEGLIFRRYYVHTVSMDAIVAKMTYRPAQGTALRAPRGASPGKRIRAGYRADGRKAGAGQVRLRQR